MPTESSRRSGRRAGVAPPHRSWTAFLALLLVSLVVLTDVLLVSDVLDSLVAVKDRAGRSETAELLLPYLDAEMCNVRAGQDKLTPLHACVDMGALRATRRLLQVTSTHYVATYYVAAPAATALPHRGYWA